MRIYKSKDGREFRLSGINSEGSQPVCTVFWIKTQQYEDFPWWKVERQLPPFEIPKTVVAEKKAKVKKEPKEVVFKPIKVKAVKVEKYSHPKFI